MKCCILLTSSNGWNAYTDETQLFYHLIRNITVTTLFLAKLFLFLLVTWFIRLDYVMLSVVPGASLLSSKIKPSHSPFADLSKPQHGSLVRAGRAGAMSASAIRCSCGVCVVDVSKEFGLPNAQPLDTRSSSDFWFRHWNSTRTLGISKISVTVWPAAE